MNTDAGRQMLAAIQQIRRFMTEVSKMLLEADAAMGQVGWEPRAGSTAMFEAATSILSSRNWLPFQVFRFYQHAEMRLLVPCISVLLESSDPKIKLVEPYVSAVPMEYETDSEVPVGVPLYQIASWHLHVPNRKDDGTLMTFEPRAHWKEHSSAKKMTSFAMPLAAIQDRDSLKRGVIARLLQVVDDSQQAGAETAV